eukprot:31210-Pelagococcus_subviridis.AAC.17
MTFPHAPSSHAATIPSASRATFSPSSPGSARRQNTSGSHPPAAIVCAWRMSFTVPPPPLASSTSTIAYVIGARTPGNSAASETDQYPSYSFARRSSSGDAAPMSRYPRSIAATYAFASSLPPVHPFTLKATAETSRGPMVTMS